ncbi:hypothetical protein BMS3Abin03_00006 [bacterium BMS3Abin03]|nr:hypothetical protein BMS3Abin03_00006 [bacterium BMS3Abin03]
MYSLFKNILTLIISALLTVNIFAQDQTMMDAKTLILSGEINPNLVVSSHRLATELGLPINIYTESGVYIEALGIKNGEPVYVAITNLTHPTLNCRSYFFNTIKELYNLEKARISYGNKVSTNDLNLISFSRKTVYSDSTFLLIPETSTNSVMMFNSDNGDLIDTCFIPPNVILDFPMQALLTPWNTISICDFGKDVIFEFDMDGSFIRQFIPKGGTNTSILDGNRSHIFLGNDTILVTVQLGTNANSIARFNADGDYMGNFIANGQGGLSGPVYIFKRKNDYLIGDLSNNIRTYGINGNYLGNFATGLDFPNEISMTADSNIVVAVDNELNPQGIHIFDYNSNFIKELEPMMLLRGAIKLSNGNYLVTNIGGVHEIDTSGIILRTVLGGVSAWHISKVTLPATSGIQNDLLSPPMRYGIKQNYPNPFNPSTKINYQLPKRSFVTLKVYDVLGNEVATLVNEEKPVGEYEVEFNAEGLPSGIYFYQLRAGSFVDTKKMLLVK